MFERSVVSWYFARALSLLHVVFRSCNTFPSLIGPWLFTVSFMVASLKKILKRWDTVLSHEHIH